MCAYHLQTTARSRSQNSTAGLPSAPTSPPTYHNHSQDYNAYSTTTSTGPKSNTLTKLVDASEDETKGYHMVSDDGRLKSTYEERTKLKHMQENITTATRVDGGDEVYKPKTQSKPVMATETRKVAYTETKVSGINLIFFLSW